VSGRCDSCGGELVTREDDTEEALAVRLRDYHTETHPALELFRRKEYVVSVDARPTPEVVQAEIRRRLHLPPAKPAPQHEAARAPAQGGQAPARKEPASA
jgi:adenylate kinase